MSKRRYEHAKYRRNQDGRGSHKYENKSAD